jgi:hypothetical protein
MTPDKLNGFVAGMFFSMIFRQSEWMGVVYLLVMVALWIWLDQRPRSRA